MCTGKGCSSATLDASHTSGGCGRAEGPMMMPPTAGGGGSVACPHRLHTLAPDRRRPPHVGVEQVTRSMAMNKVQVSSSTTEPVWWCVMCFRSPLALWKPLRGHLLHQYEPSWNEKAEVGGALGSGNWSGNSRVHSSHARACKNVTVHDLDRGGGPRNRRWGQRQRGAAIGKRQPGWEEKADPRQESQARRQEEATPRRRSWSSSGIPGPVPGSWRGPGHRASGQQRCRPEEDAVPVRVSN